MPIRALILTLALFLAAPASALADGGNILGTVYLDGQPGGGICVDVFDNASNDVASQLTNGSGDYNIYVAQPGSYSVRFSDCGAGFVVTQWYANPVEVVSDAITPQVNGYLSSAGRITGHVIDTLNAVVTGACVEAEDQNGSPLGQTTTDGNGNYVLGGLPAGETHIRFESCAAGNFVPEYYDDAQSPLTSQPIAVEASHTTTGIDAVLTPGGRIAGHVQNADGAPLQGMCISVRTSTSDVGTATTDENGNYQVLGVPPSGNFDLAAIDCAGGTYLVQYRKGVPAAGTGTRTVDFTLPRPAFITGHVTGDAHGLASICVTGKDADSGDTVTAESDRNGYYELNSIAPGTYDLSFEDCHATGDWVAAGTTGVAVGDGETLNDVDKVLTHPDPAPPAAGPPVAAAGGSTAPHGDDASSPGGDPHPTVALPRTGCKVPKLVGLSLSKAKKRLAKANCRTGRIIRTTRTHRRGRVIRQSSKPGVRRAAGARIRLTVAA